MRTWERSLRGYGQDRREPARASAQGGSLACPRRRRRFRGIPRRHRRRLPEIAWSGSAGEAGAPDRFPGTAAGPGPRRAGCAAGSTPDGRYSGFARITATVRSVHAAPERCGFRSGSTADGHGIPASFRARVIRAALCTASRCVNIHCTTGAVTGSGSSRWTRRPHAASRLVRMRARVGQLVPVRRATAQVASLLSEAFSLTGATTTAPAGLRAEDERGPSRCWSRRPGRAGGFHTRTGGTRNGP